MTLPHKYGGGKSEKGLPPLFAVPGQCVSPHRMPAFLR